MKLLCPDELALLEEAADSPDGVLDTQVAGPGAIDHFARLVHATSLQLAGYLEPIADAGPFARWRIRPAILAEVREVIGAADARPAISSGRGR